MTAHASFDVPRLPDNRMLAFNQTVGHATAGGREFEVTRDLTGMHLAFHEKVDGKTVIHTLDLSPVLEAALDEILQETT